MTDGGLPHFEPLWEAPPFDSPEALERFRTVPTLAVLTTAPDGGAYVWLVDRTGSRDRTGHTLIGIRAADGTIVVRQHLQGAVEAYSLAHDDDVVYVTSHPPGGGVVVLEAFRILY